MKRYDHYWWAVKGQYSPSRIGVFDCDVTAAKDRCGDTTGELLAAAWSLTHCELRAGLPCAPRTVNGDGTVLPWDAFSRLVTSKENTWLIIPYAGAVLAALGFWDRLQAGDIILSGKDWREERIGRRGGEDKRNGLCVIEDPPFMVLCQLRSRPGKLLFLDSRNYGIDTFNWRGNSATRAKRLFAGILDCLHALRADNPVSLRGTSGAQAVQALRTNWDTRSLHCTADVESNRLARDSSYGGRCECWRIGTIREKTYVVDVRNMYPALCLTLPLPVSLRYSHDDQSRAYAAIASVPESCIASCEVETDRPMFPVRKYGLVVYPVGRFRTILAGPELLLGIRRGNIRKAFTAAQYTMRPVLSGFYEHWLGKLAHARQQGQEILCQFIKSMMVALPGKFLEPGRRWIPVPFSGNIKPYAEYYVPQKDGTLVRQRDMAGYTQREELHDESYWSIPAIGSFITSAGRVRIWSFAEQAGRGNVFYVDTDSLYTNQLGFDSLLRNGLIRDGEIGHLRLIGQGNGCTIYGIRDVRCGHIVKCSGVPREEHKQEESRASYWHRQKAKAEIALGRKPGSGGTGGSVVTPEKYRHGTVQSDGRVLPFLLSER